MGYYLRRHLTPDQIKLVAVNAAIAFSKTSFQGPVVGFDGSSSDPDIDMEIDIDLWVVRVWGGGVRAEFGITEMLEML